MRSAGSYLSRLPPRIAPRRPADPDRAEVGPSPSPRHPAPPAVRSAVRVPARRSAAEMI